MKMRARFILTLSVVLFASGLSDCLAFNLDDHEAITRHAAAEFLECFPDSLSEYEIDLLVQMNLDEDTDLLRKWTSYNHFYNPEKPIETTWRATSWERVTNLQDVIQEAFSLNWNANLLADPVGHLLHHVQDAASPPHVIPVNHWLTDGFERFNAGRVAPPGELNCSALDQIGDSMDEKTPINLLKQTAQSTLNFSRAGLSALYNGTRISIPWSYYWEESRDRGFGEYGRLGNGFGQPVLFVRAGVYRVSEATYRQAKDQQIRLAVEATKKALAWITRKGIPVFAH